MRNQRSIGVNAGLNMIRTAFQVIFPLITFPYVSRVLHVENIGIYNFCQSVISYFSLLAALGISTYAIREGARYRDNEEKMSLFASEVFSINFISTVFSYLILGVCILLVPRFNQYSSIMVALSISIMFTLIGSEWIFQIYEDYKYITIRGILFQFISLILMFVLVRNSSDLFAYVWITVISCSGANILNAVSRRKYCKIRLTINAKILTHLAPILVLFATSVATTIYTNADTSIFSWFYTSCILIPYRCENKVLMATIVAALVNIGLNFILIPTFQQNAAAFTTVIAELLSMVITWWYGRKYFRVSFLKKDILSVAIGCLAIWTICSISEKYISSVLISTVFSVTASVVIYMIVLLIMKNQAVKLVLEILHIKK